MTSWSLEGGQQWEENTHKYIGKKKIIFLLENPKNYNKFKWWLWFKKKKKKLAHNLAYN
jgi:hypothetical protein